MGGRAKISTASLTAGELWFVASHMIWQAVAATLLSSKHSNLSSPKSNVRPSACNA